MKDAFQYLFRFCCDPAFHGEQELEALPRFIAEAGIDDVIVFVNAQEINTGHITPAEQETWMAFAYRVKDIAAANGATVSVNPWSTLMHADLGRSLRSGQRFRCMVDPEGHEAALCACPLDEEWRSHITGVYARYAELHPAFVWVEDDFRLHNHAPLVWGGCFCEEHMRRYSELAGKGLTREEFVRGLLEPGAVHPYRQIWLDVNRQAMAETACLIGKAVHDVSPLTRVGLMSSVPEMHAAEGRDWHGILHGLQAGSTLPPVDRAHLPGYIEPTPADYLLNFNAVPMLTRALAPPETEIYPELENFPFSRFAKSRRFTRFQLLSAPPLGAPGITIDLYDLSGGGILWGEGYQDVLRETKEFLNEVTNTKLLRRDLDGIRVLVSEKSSYTLFTEQGSAMEELYPRETFWASLLPALGIPFAYQTDANIRGKIAAVSGQYFRNLTQEQICALFAENLVLMDGEAAETLFDLGLGSLAGIFKLRRMEQNGGEYSFEQTCDGRPHCGMNPARVSAMFFASDAYAVEYEGETEQYSVLCDCFRQATAPGLTLGTPGAVVFPFRGLSDSGEVPRLFLNNCRQSLLQGLLRDARNRFEVPPFFLESPFLNPYYVVTDTGFLFYLLNGSTDDYAELRLDAGAGASRIRTVEALESVGGGWHRVEYARQGGTLILRLGLCSMEAVLLRFAQ